MDIPEWVVTDLDETLLRNDNSVSDFTLSTLDRIRAAGTKFAIATGRYKAFTQPYIDMLKPDALVVCGGAIGMMDDEVVHYQTMDPTLLNQLLGDLEKLPVGRPTLIDSSLGRIGDKRPIERPFPHDAYQLILWLESALPPNLIAYWSQHFLITTLWLPGLYRIGSFKANKLDALKTILCDVDPVRVFTFGDDPIDAGMLAYFQGVAVANARVEAREAAHYHTVSNEEDGVARWIVEQFFS